MASSGTPPRRGVTTMPKIAFRLAGFLSPDIRDQILRADGADWHAQTREDAAPLDQMRQFLDAFRASGRENVLMGATLVEAVYGLPDSLGEDVWNWWASHCDTPDVPSVRFMRDDLVSDDQRLRETVIRALGGDVARAWIGLLEPEAQEDLNTTWHAAAAARLDLLDRPQVRGRTRER